MSVIHRALFTLLTFSLFIILIALKLDNKSEWNWFVVFVPMFALDLIVVIMLGIKWWRHSTSGRSPLSSSGRHWGLTASRLNDKLYCLTCVLSKLCFQVILCLRLQYIANLSLYIVFIPLWVCLISSLTYFMTRFLTNRSLFA